MNDLTHLFQVLLHLFFPQFESLVAQIDRVGQQFASLLDALRIGPLPELDPFALEKVAQVSEKFFMIDFVHSQ